MKEKLSKFIDILCESLYFLVITYTLSSMQTSFNLHWYSILFGATDLFAMRKYYEAVKATTGSKAAAIIALVLCWVVFALISWKVGYIRGEFTQFKSLY